MFNSCVLLFHLVWFFFCCFFSLKNRMCLNRTVFTFRKLLVHLSWIFKCVWLSIQYRASQHEPTENWLCFQRFALSDKHLRKNLGMLWHISIITYKRLSEAWQISLYVILHLKKKTSRKCLTRSSVTTLPIFTIKCTCVLPGILLRTHSHICKGIFYHQRIVTAM